MNELTTETSKFYFFIFYVGENVLFKKNRNLFLITQELIFNKLMYKS